MQQAIRASMALAIGLLLVGVTASAQDLDRDGSRELAGLQTTPNGSLPGAEAETELSPEADSATACFQLNNDAGVTWFINAVLGINSYPYTVTGGSISGTICDSPNWLLTGTLVGPTLTINGTHTGGGGCADTVTIVGRFGPPAGYKGAYGFDGAGDTFKHRMLFLGFNRACP